MAQNLQVAPAMSGFRVPTNRSYSRFTQHREQMQVGAPLTLMQPD
jgi:hypothetical protein